MPLLKIAGPELVAGVSGESEARIRELFDQALALSPCVLFLDEIDALAPHRATAQKEMERRIVSQLLACLDGKFSILYYNEIISIVYISLLDSVPSLNVILFFCNILDYLSTLNKFQ